MWAKDSKKMDVIEAYDVMRTDFEKVASTVSISMAKAVSEALKKDIANLADYRVVGENIKSLGIDIDDFEAENPMPVLKLKKTAEANKQLKDLFSQINDKMTNVVDLVKSEYEESNPQFVDMVISANALDEIGSRSTKLIVTVIDKTGQPVAEAMDDVLEMTGEEQLGADNGELTIEGMKKGTYHIEESKAELKHTEKFTIKSGE